MKIIQLTDLHISAKHQKAKGNVDTRVNFLRMLDHLSSVSFDHLVITGDFCLTDPYPEIYEWVTSECARHWELSQIRVISGNHDDTNMMCQSFGRVNAMTNDEYYFEETIESYSTFYLDTSKASSSVRQKEWLEKTVENTRSDQVIIFMHYPPAICDVPYMDQHHHLLDMADFQDFFARHNDKRFHIFCGHYHVDRFITFDNINLYISPSCYVQIDSNYEEFVPDHYRIGYRVIDITDTKLTTYVKYLP